MQGPTYKTKVPDPDGSCLPSGLRNIFCKQTVKKARLAVELGDYKDAVHTANMRKEIKYKLSLLSTLLSNKGDYKHDNSDVPDTADTPHGSQDPDFETMKETILSFYLLLLFVFLHFSLEN